MKCRHCGAELKRSFVDLGRAPPSNSYLSKDALQDAEKIYPLRVMVCESCWLVQTEDFADRSEFFSEDYAYFSSFSETWLRHAEEYVATAVDRFGLDETSHVVEVAANDGYLLQYIKARNIPCRGIEPTASTAEAARKKGLEIVEDFFGRDLATRLRDKGKGADLMAANNVLAHVPDINDFVAGFAIMLQPDGVATFEFPHLLKMVNGIQFDTIYHEHFSYLSLMAAQNIFSKNGLDIFDVEELPTHGGSLRVYAQRADKGTRSTEATVGEMLRTEKMAGISSESFYDGFQDQVDRVKSEFLSFLDDVTKKGKTVAAYGAAAKGNTLLNYCGVGAGAIDFVVDRNPAKQGKFLPGSHIPIVDVDRLRTDQPDYVVILPWNLKEEVMGQLDYIRAWDSRFVVAIPELDIW